VLAVIVDFETKQAAIGTQAGSAVPTSEILAALESIGYQGQLVEHPTAEDDAATVESDAP
jgi:hypothetical protein